MYCVRREGDAPLSRVRRPTQKTDRAHQLQAKDGRISLGRSGDDSFGSQVRGAVSGFLARPMPFVRQDVALE